MGTKERLRTSVVLGLMSVFATAVVGADLGPELIVNGNFESEGDPFPGWSFDSTTQGPLLDDDPAHGKVLEFQVTGGWTVDPATGKRTPPWTGDRYGGRQTVTVTPGARYRLHFDRKTVAVHGAGRAGFAIEGATVVGVASPGVVQNGTDVYWDHGLLKTPAKGTRYWVSQTIDLQATGTSIAINGYGVYSCTARIDNVSLRQILAASQESSGPPRQTRAEADGGVSSPAPTTVNAEPLALLDKKIIGFAPGLVDASYLKDNVAQLERLSIDGLVISIHPDWQKLSEGDLYFGRTNLSRGGKFRRKDYQQSIADLKATEFKRFTDNFIDFALCAQNRYDWFDENWSVYAHNAAVLAYVAKQAGLNGLLMDVEQYGGMNVPVPHPFRYSWREDRSQRSFDEVADQVRKRGRELMEAITASYPDITVITIPTLGWGGGSAEALLPAFADGLLEGLGPQATLIDGMENAYPLMRHSNFAELRAFAEKGGVERSRIPEIYETRVQYGLGLWIDFDARTNGTYNGWRTDPQNLHKNYRSPERLEHSLYNALTASDKYVWLFAIHPQVWWQPHLLKKENHDKQRAVAGTGWRCKLCPHPEIPEEYIDAIRNCRKPRDLNWGSARVRAMEEDALQSWCPMLVKTKPLTPEALSAIGPNILKNSSFETWREPRIADSWHFETEKREEHGRYVSREDTVVKEGSHSLEVSSAARVQHIYVTQSFPAAEYAGKTVTCGIWCKSSFDQLGNVNVIDFIETTGRKDEVATKTTRYEGKDGWWFITATKTIRKDATRISIYLGSSIPLSEGGTLYYDGAIAVVRE